MFSRAMSASTSTVCRDRMCILFLAIACVLLTSADASAWSRNAIGGVYVRATGNTHSIAYEYSMANAAGFTVTTQSFAAGSYRARVAFDLAAWPSGGIGILLNTVGNDAKRCSFANAVETASPHRLTFDVYCVLPSIGGAWAYTTSDFQVVIHNSEYYNSPFAI